MMRRRHFLIAGLALGVASVGTVFAQTSMDGLDLDAIDRRAQAEAVALADLVDRAIARTDSSGVANAAAHRTADAAKAALGEAAARANSVHLSEGGIDLDAMVAAAGTATAPTPRPSPQFLAFASLAMPQDSLRQMIDDVSRASGTVVFRGFAPQGAGAFLQALSAVVPSGTQARITIDPRLFKAFGIEAVPTYVALAGGFVPCTDCTANPGAFDKLAGNVTAAFAAETIADGNGPGAPVARAALTTLRKEP